MSKAISDESGCACLMTAMSSLTLRSTTMGELCTSSVLAERMGCPTNSGRSCISKYSPRKPTAITIQLTSPAPIKPACDFVLAAGAATAGVASVVMGQEKKLRNPPPGFGRPSAFLQAPVDNQPAPAVHPTPPAPWKSAARRARSGPLAMPSFSLIRWRCVSTVFTVTCSSSATARVPRPRPMR